MRRRRRRVFFPETDCANITCEPPGACCDGGTCTEVAEADCVGLYQGDGTACDADVCALGSCCGIDGVCIDDFIASQCISVGDIFQTGPGTRCADFTCEPRAACCDGGNCTLVTEADCAGVYQGDSTVCETETCDLGSCCAEAGGCSDSVVASQCAGLGDVFRPGVDCAQLPCGLLCGMADLTGIVFADADPIAAIPFDQPGNCAIDARQPYDINDLIAREGWDRMVMTFSCDPAAIGMVSGDFTVSVVPAGVAPGVSSVDIVGNTATVMLDDKITPAQWTCIAHPGSGSQWCMGYLPTDAGQDGLSTASDINTLINAINLVPGASLPIYATDINRSGVTTGVDILRLIDLLNGAGDFDPWIAQSLPPCPAP